MGTKEHCVGNGFSRAMIWAEKRRYPLLLVLSLLLSVFLRLPYFQHDFIFVDEAHWANGANVLHQGGLLYLDIALDKNPPIFWFCAFLFKLFGVHMTAIHLGALLLVLGTSVLLYLIGARFFSKSTGAAAALIHAVASTTYYIPRIIGMNTEILMVFFSSIAVLFYLQALLQDRRFGFFAAGFFASCAFLTKPVAGTELALLVLFLFWSSEHKLAAKIYSGFVLVSGAILGLGLFAVHMHRTGILTAWWDQAVMYAFRYVNRISIGAFLDRSLRVTVVFGIVFAWLFILILLSRSMKSQNVRAYAFLVCWLAAAFAGVVIGRRYYANYFIQLMPPLSLLGGVGLSHLWRNRSQGRLRVAARVCCTAFLISFVWFHSRTLANWFSLAFPQVHNVKLWDMGQEDMRNREIAEYIRTRSLPQDKIFVWGSKPQLFFLAHRQPATGWMDYDVADDYPPRAAETETQIRTAEFLRSTKPRYIIDVQQSATIDRYPIFQNLIDELYSLESQVSGSRLYGLRDQQVKTSSPEGTQKEISGVHQDFPTAD
jgi:hypothetical protein